MEIKKSSVKLWRERNKEKVRSGQERNRSTRNRKEYMREFRKRNKEHKHCTDQKHNWDAKVRVLKLVAQGGLIECKRCGIKDKRILQIHHKFGNGERDRKFYYKTNLLIRVQNSKEKVAVEELEIRCCNCNIIAEYEDLKRRYTNIIGFDENFDPIWKVMPRKVLPLDPLSCDFCGCRYFPNSRRESKYHFCRKECYASFMKKMGYPNKKNEESGRYERKIVE